MNKMFSAKRFCEIVLAAAFNIALLFTNTSCSDFGDLNTDPNRIEQINPGSLLSPILYGLNYNNASRWHGFTADLVQITAPTSSSSPGGVHRYVLTDGAGNSTWSTYYRWLTNLNELVNVSQASGLNNYIAVSLTLRAWSVSILTDCFGDIPYTEACQGMNNLRPVFDKQEDIYNLLLSDLERANSLYNTSAGMSYGGDILYSNNASRWQMFTNSLRLRLLLRVAKVNPSKGNAALKAILDDPKGNPIFKSSDDQAVFIITGTAPNLSPWPRILDFGGTYAEFFMNIMNATDDPRRSVFATRELVDTQTGATGYIGIKSGYLENQTPMTGSRYQNSLVDANMKVPMCTYSEVEFIKAELIQKGVITGNAETAYKNAVTSSIELWCGKGSVSETFFANPAVAYNGTLERILTEKYLSLCWCDYQQWFEIRRTGLPVLPLGEAVIRDGGKMPKRFRYPLTVRTENPANYEKVVVAMGGEDFNTAAWWDK